MYQNIARCNMYMGHCDLCTEEMGGCQLGDYRLAVRENRARINRAIANTIQLAGPKKHGIGKGYWSSVLAQRVPGPKAKGSIFEGKTPRRLSKEIKTASWEEAENEHVFPGCVAFKTTDIHGGMYGVVPLADLPDDADLVILDQKNTGYASLCVNGGMRVPAEETWIILGPCNTGEEVVYTLHPGAPTDRAKTPTDMLPVGTHLTKADAIKKGFNTANVL